MKKFRARLRALEETLGIKALPVPVLIVEYVACGERDPNGRLGPPPEPTSGCVDDEDRKRIDRKPGETVDAFKDRLVSLASKIGRVPPQVFLFSPEDPPDA